MPKKLSALLTRLMQNDPNVKLVAGTYHTDAGRPSGMDFHALAIVDVKNGQIFSVDSED